MAPELPKRDYAADAVGPLAGVRVLDLSRLVAGNTLTQMLGDFGAEVVKVEPPTGDTLRAWKTNGVETSWKLFARNKKSLCLDLKSPEARDILRRLIPSAHMLIESFRPGTLEAMGLAPDALHALNPKLVIVRISGWGQDGPYRRRPGFGTLVEGMSGFATMNGFADREPVLPPMYLADSVAGLYGAGAAMIALRAAERDGGRGQVIDLALLDPLVAILGPQAGHYRLTGEMKGRTGSRSTTSAPRNVYRCNDGLYVCLSASIQKMAERLFRAIDRADLIADPRYASNAARVANAADLDAIIGAFVATRTQAETVAYFEAAEVTIGPIYDTHQIMADRHVQARALLADYPDSDIGAFPMIHVPARLSETPGTIRSEAPALGADNVALLAGIGINGAEFARLRMHGVVCDARALTGGEHKPANSAEET